MGTKLAKGTYPVGHRPEDFKCFGPTCTEDGQFDNCKIADMGCFDQSGKDSNKMYHAAVVQSRINQKWFTYFEWGRTGASSPQFQFVECSSEADAQREFADQLHDKNDKRGMWTTIAGIRTLKAKPNKDCYLVRPMAQRSTGLPDAKTIKSNEGAKVSKVEDKPKDNKKTPSKRVDTHTIKLMRDLNGATVSYTRGSMADSSLPTQKSIDEARQIIQEAQKRLIVVGDKVQDQVADNELVQLTKVMYGRIPKKKALHCAAKDWILNSDNILMWQADLDAFESALYVHDDNATTVGDDPLDGMPLDMEWIDPNSSLGKFLMTWWPRASANRHAGVGAMKIKNLWKVERHGEDGDLAKGVAKIKMELQSVRVKERPLHQPPERHDCPHRAKDFADSNTHLLFHGTRTQNVTGILRTGFREPKNLVNVIVTGAMFSGGGGGLYMADDWRKSAGYTSMHGSYYSSGSGGVKGRDAFMFACDVTLGNPHVAAGPHPYMCPPKGTHCIFGKAGVSGVQNNEFIVFDRHQRAIRYLAEFTA